MRLLPIAALILVSLTFSVGGVAIVGRADAADPAPKTAAPAPASLGQTQCTAPVQHDVRIPATRVQGGGDVVVLNTRGYNYALPGDLPMDPVSGRALPVPVTPAARKPAPEKPEAAKPSAPKP